MRKPGFGLNVIAIDSTGTKPSGDNALVASIGSSPPIALGQPSLPLKKGPANSLPAAHVLHESIGIRGNAHPLSVDAFPAQCRSLLFPELVLRETMALDTQPSEQTLGWEGREPVEGVVLSIDDASVTDLDNALSYRRLPNGEHVVGVHAVDAAAMVRQGSALDATARMRASTLYLGDTGVWLPMIPRSLCEDKLGLVRDALRRTKSVELRFSADGNPLGGRIFRSSLTNKYPLTPEQATGALLRPADAALADALTQLTLLAGQRGVDKMLAHFTTMAARFVGEQLADAGIETSYRNQVEEDLPAVYEPQPKGHVALNARAYVQWTGPMRRYADIDVQRGMDRLIDGRKPKGLVAQKESALREAQLTRDNVEPPDDPRGPLVGPLLALMRESPGRSAQTSGAPGIDACQQGDRSAK